MSRKLCDKHYCQDGYIFDAERSRMVKCPFCEEIRGQQVLGGVREDGEELSLSEKLGFRRIFDRLIFDIENVVGQKDILDYDRELVQGISDQLSQMISLLTEGRAPQTSVLVYLGNKADVEVLAYNILGVAYKSGLVTHPFVTPYRLRKLRKDEEKYDDLVNSDVVAVTFNTSNKDDSFLVETLLKERAYEGKATYLIVNDPTGLNGVLNRIGASTTQARVSKSQCLYIGFPALSNEEHERVKRVNRVIKFSNSSMGINIPEVEVEAHKNKPQPKSNTHFTQGKLPI